MGNNIPSCSCMKKNDEEKKAEFLPESVNTNINKSNRNLLLNTESSQPSLHPSQPNNKLDLKLTKNTTFSFRFLEKSKTLNPDKIKIIQTIFRAFIFRKHFFENKGLKDDLKKRSKEIIQQKELDYISEKLMETDNIIKKEFNDDFLIKLKLKESNKDFPPKRKVKTDCLLRKDSKGEDLFYRGELDLDGKFNGYGELYLKNGKKYEGKFTDGKLNDYGRLIDLFGIKCYEGKFKDNQLLDGKGKIVEIGEDGSKTVYEGDIKNMKKEGNGIEKKKDYTYMGQFSDDLKHGKGKNIFNDGEIYEGDFNKGKMTGTGTYQFKDKSQYTGEFLDGKMHGKGIITYPNGTKFDGNFVDNSREGYGEYYKANGQIFKGNYKKGKKHGKGIIINPNGAQKEVEYNEDILVKKRNDTEKD